MQPTAIVLHGPTSAGKTTLAKALQATSPVPAFHVSLDAFVTMSNRRDMRNDEERARAYKLHCENLRSTLTRIAKTEFDIILDLVLRDESELQACLKVLSGRATYLIGVSAPSHVLEARERARPDRASGIAREQAADPVYKRRYDLMLDTSTTTPEAGAAAVRKLVKAKTGDAKMPGHRIFSTAFAAVYPMYVQKAKRKGRTQAEVDRVICWLTGYDRAGLQRQIKQKADFEAFFAQAPAIHPNSALIKGVVCGVRVEEVEDPLMQKIRWLDKLVDELAKGKAMEKVLRQ